MAKRQISGFEYAASAVDRIRQKEADDVAGFFAEISQTAVNQAVSILPNLSGFRPNSEQGVHQQVQLLAKRLVGSQPHKPKNAQRDLDVLGFAWMKWGIEHLGDASIVEDYIDRSQVDERDETGDIDDKANGDDPLAIELFEKLRDLSHTNKCGRADIKRFFEFSPFGNSERLLSIIESCKPAVEVARDKSIATLPKKVERAEQEIADLFKAVDTLSKDERAHAEKLSALSKDFETLQKVTADSNETALGVLKRLDEVLTEVTSQKKQATEETAAIEKLVQNLAVSIEKLQTDLTEIVDQVNPLIETSETADKAISDISAELDQMRESMTEFLAIVNPVSSVELSIDTESDGGARNVEQARNIVLERFRGVDRPTEPAALRHGEDFVSAVAANLEGLNIKKSSAEALALECVAALAAGQIPHFAGVNGKRVAEACAMALAASDTCLLTVPVGISAPNEFRRQLWSLSATDRKDVGCVIIDGINRSALDAFGECLIEMIARQRSGDRASRSLLVVATVTDGPASLPLSHAHISLGPVFYTDALDWRMRHRAETQMADGVISAEIWEKACSAVEQTTPDSDEALRLLGEFAPIANPLLRGTVLSGFRALSALRNEQTDLTALQSLAFGWISPLCVVMGASAEAVDQEFDQGIVDGTRPDTRLANLLRLGVFNGVQREGV